ncbi:MAG: hypothetical protein OQJ81_11270, partial [Melioribacteraceae bacterium]|nr:hypothetical protein [Melioribacteraceae bacterium]
MNRSISVSSDFRFLLKFAILILFLISTTSIAQFDEFEQLNGPYGFRVNKIIISDSDEIYLCPSWEGVFYSDNSGESWTNLGLKNEDIHDLVVDSKGTIYVLINNYWKGGKETAGIFKSADNGNSWEISNFGITEPAVRAITVDNNDKLYVGTKNGGMFYSEDYAESWKNIGLEDLFIRVVEADNNGRIYAAIDGNGVYYKDSDSTNWEKLGELSFYRCQDIYISSQGDVYVALGSPIGSMGVYKYDSYQQIWYSLSEHLDDWQIESVFRTENGILLAGATNGRVYMSLDEGESWNLSTIGLTTMDVTSIRGNSRNEIFFATLGSGFYKYDENNQEWNYVGPKINLAVNAIVEIDNKIYCSTSPGIYYSGDYGKSWVGMSKYISPHEMSGIVMYDSVNFASATWGGGVYYSDNSCSTWNLSSGIPYYSTVYYIEKSPTTNNIFVGILGDAHGLYKSVDGGKSFNQIMQWERPEAIHFTSTGEIYIGTWDIHYSNNDGESWKRLRKGI